YPMIKTSIFCMYLTIIFSLPYSVLRRSIKDIKYYKSLHNTSQIFYLTDGFLYKSTKLSLFLIVIFIYLRSLKLRYFLYVIDQTLYYLILWKLKIIILDKNIS
ncbi:hypothetical protein ACJX0J_012211, partial [Zea mays]